MRTLILFLTVLLLTSIQAFAEGDCTVKIVQYDKEIAATPSHNLMVYKLVAAPFRIEVSPDNCDSSIVVTSSKALSYISQAPLVFANGAQYMASGPDEIDNLATALRDDDPNTTVQEVIEMQTSNTQEQAWAKQQYEQICSASQCPTPARAFSCAWPFLDPVTKNSRDFAEFKRWDNLSMDSLSGKVLPVIVYTLWKRLNWSENSGFIVLQPHAMALDFRQ
jgi:hypothetical protein